jgi:DNA polymerase IV
MRTLEGTSAAAVASDSWIVYVDLDAYYVSCEVRDRPELVGKEVIVGPPPAAGPSRGVVLSASYEARRHGVKSAMPAQAAARLAPDAVWVAPDFEKYERVAEQVRELLRRFSPDVLPLSIDEAAVGLGSVSADEARAVAEDVQRALRRELNLPASLGVATTRVVAKIATDRAKPGGILVVKPSEVASFLEPLPVRAIPGVGPKTEALLDALDVRTIGEIARRRPRDLERVLGSFARDLLALARGTPGRAARGRLGPPGPLDRPHVRPRRHLVGGDRRRPCRDGGGARRVAGPPRVSVWGGERRVPLGGLHAKPARGGTSRRRGRTGADP